MAVPALPVLDETKRPLRSGSRNHKQSSSGRISIVWIGSNSGLGRAVRPVAAAQQAGRLRRHRARQRVGRDLAQDPVEIDRRIARSCRAPSPVDPIRRIGGCRIPSVSTHRRVSRPAGLSAMNQVSQPSQ